MSFIGARSVQRGARRGWFVAVRVTRARGDRAFYVSGPSFQHALQLFCELGARRQWPWQAGRLTSNDVLRTVLAYTEWLGSCAAGHVAHQLCVGAAAAPGGVPPEVNSCGFH